MRFEFSKENWTESRMISPSREGGWWRWKITWWVVEFCENVCSTPLRWSAVPGTTACSRLYALVFALFKWAAKSHSPATGRGAPGHKFGLQPQRGPSEPQSRGSSPDEKLKGFAHSGTACWRSPQPQIEFPAQEWTSSWWSPRPCSWPPQTASFDFVSITHKNFDAQASHVFRKTIFTFVGTGDINVGKQMNHKMKDLVWHCYFILVQFVVRRTVLKKFCLYGRIWNVKDHYDL